MKINVLEGATLNEATLNLVHSIDNSNLDEEHFVVVPDRFSLQMEMMLLKNLPRGAMFNVSVVGITELVAKLLQEIGVGKIETVSGADALLLTNQAIKNKRSAFECFKKSSINFCQEVYKCIMQFRSCGVEPRDLMIKNGTPSQKRKFHDLALIFEEYTRLLNGKLDANGLLEYFVVSIAGSKVLANKKFYFAMFDSFTKKTFDIIEVIAPFAKELNFALPRPISEENAYIYETDILDKIKKIAIKNSQIVNFVSPKTALQGSQKFLAQNLFGLNTRQEEGGVVVLSSRTAQEEVETVGKLIRFKVTKGARYRDFAVACGQAEYAIYEKVFEQLDIPYYIDKSDTADQTILAKFLFAIFNVFITDYSKESLKALLNNSIISLDLCNVIDRQNIFGRDRFKRYFSRLAPEIDEVLGLFYGTTFSEIAQACERVIERYHDKTSALYDKIKEAGFDKEYNINVQAEEIVLESLNKLKQIGDEPCSKSEFLKALKLLLSFKEVSSVPTYVDAVMIGDATASFFGEVENLIVTGGEKLPLVAGDNGLISDDDIEKISEIKKIEPSIRMINRRNRFKLFNLLTSAKKLFIFFQEFNEEGKKVELPSYIEGILKLFNLSVVKSGALSQIDDNSSLDRILFNFGSRKFALEQGYASGDFVINRDHINVNAHKLFFPKDYTKVTQLETYFSCPFKHFITYGLAPRDEENDFDARDIGNIAHSFAEKFVNFYGDKLAEVEEVDSFIEDNLIKIINELNLQDKFEFCTVKDTFLTYLRKMLKMLLSRIVKEQKVSSFRPLYTEKNISGSLKYPNGTISLVGKIDRVDVCGDYFRIMDYKTGLVSPILKDLYYGKKIQLFLYQSEAEKMLKKTAGGTFYFDARWDFEDEENGDVILKGIVRNDEDLIACFDKNATGEIIAVTRCKKGFTGRALAKGPLSAFNGYAERLTAKALEEIDEGYIQPKPFDKECERCKLRSICMFDKTLGYRKGASIVQSDILNIMEVDDGTDK